MKVYRNLGDIRRKEQLGRRLSMTGLAVLFAGLLASFVPNWLPPDQPVANPISAFVQQYWVWISFAALPIGFLLASVGSYYINRFARRRWPGSKGFARPDEILERSMKGFDDKYAYFAWSLPANHVLAGPCGILVIAMRSDKGRVIVQGDRWREPFSFGRFFSVFAREGVGNPAFELEEQIKRLQKILAEGRQSDEPQADEPQDDGANGKVKASKMPIEPVAIFLNSQMQIELENPTVTVLRADQVKDFVRRKAREAKVPSNEVRDTLDILVANANYQTSDE